MLDSVGWDGKEDKADLRAPAGAIFGGKDGDDGAMEIVCNKLGASRLRAALRLLHIFLACPSARRVCECANVIRLLLNVAETHSSRGEAFLLIFSRRDY